MKFSSRASRFLVGFGIGFMASMALDINPAHAVVGGESPPVDSVANSVVKVGYGSTNCSGVMISPSWALTAKHCVDHDLLTNTINVMTPIKPGINRDEGTYSATIHMHPYTDVALLNINGYHDGTIAELPSSLPDYTDMGTTGLFVGFGGSDTIVNHAESLNVELHGIARFNDLSRKDKNNLGTYLAVEKKLDDTAQIRYGDSGGPLFFGNEVHGIFSIGNYQEEEKEFINPYFASVGHMSDWIYDTTGIHNPNTQLPYGNLHNTTQWQQPYVNPQVTDNGPATKAGSQLSSNALGFVEKITTSSS